MSTLTEAEKIAKYDAERDGSLYATVTDLIDEEDEEEDEKNDVLIGYVDSMPVLANYITDFNDPDQDGLASATVVWQGIRISTDGDSYLNLPVRGEMVGDLPPAEWPLIKALARTDVCERLMSLARRAPRFRDVPSVPPPAPLVTVERFVCDDELDRRHGQELGISYACGSSWVYFPHDGSLPGIRTFDADITTDLVDRHLDDLIALLSDPRVKAAREAQR